jgi:glutamate/tyrosine decarboxylase-like PLP-dependent enzyme
MTDATLPALARALAHATAHIEGLDAAPAMAPIGVGELRRRLGVPMADDGLPAEQVIDELVAATLGGHNGSAGGRFFGWVIGGALPSALAADWLTSAWDNNSGIYACAPAASVVEEVAAKWLTQLLDLPEDTGVGFVTGCQLAHVTALAAARHALLARRGWDVEAKGLYGAPPIRVIVNEDRHATVDRAVRFLGMGQDHLEVLPLAEDARLAPETLEAALAASDAPTIVVLQAADLNLGVFDDFRTLIPMARAAGAWAHVDGAFGLWAKASPSKRPLVAGVELADSWATDGHKWLNVPYDSGLVFVRDAEAMKGAMTQYASYVSPEGDARDAIAFGPEFSRRGRGYPVYAALRELGRTGLADLIDRTCGHCHAMATRIGALPGAQLIAEPTLNQAIVRFHDRRPDATDADHDARTQAVINAVNASGEALFSGAVWRGRRVMRISVCSWRTNAADVDRAVAAVASALEA